MIKENEVFKIGRFAKPHGIKGELSFVTNSDVLENDEDPYIVCDMEGILVPFFIEEYRYKTDSVILLKLEDVDTDEDADVFVGKDVYYPLSKMDEESLIDSMTWESFVGYKVIDEHEGCLGSISYVDESTLNVLLCVDHDGDVLHIPAVDEFIMDVDHEERTLTVSLPEGLLDL